MPLRLAKCSEEGHLESIILVVVRRISEDSFHLSGGSVVQRGDDIIKLCLVYRNPFGAELRLDTSGLSVQNSGSLRATA